MRRSHTISACRGSLLSGVSFYCLVIAAALLGTARFCAADSIPISIDAAKVEDFDRAVETARMRDALLAVYYVPASVTLTNPNCPLCIAATEKKVGEVESMAKAAKTPSVIRVAIRQTDTIPSSLAAANIKLEGTGVYFLDASLRQVGHASIDSADDVKRLGKVMVQVADWRRMAHHRVELAMEDGNNGHITAAVKKLKEIAAQDSAISRMVQEGWKNVDTVQSTDSNEPGFFFPDLVSKSTEQMAKKVQDAVDYATQLYENGRLSKTRTLIHLPDGSTAVQRDDLG